MAKIILLHIKKEICDDGSIVRKFLDNNKYLKYNPNTNRFYIGSCLEGNCFERPLIDKGDGLLIYNSIEDSIITSLEMSKETLVFIMMGDVKTSLKLTTVWNRRFHKQV